MEKKRRRKALEVVFGRSVLSGDGINCAVACPACDKKKKKKKLVVRLDDGRYQCWVCAIKGNSISYLAKKYFSNFEIVLGAFPNRSQKLRTVIEPEKQQLKLPTNAFFLGNNSIDPDHKAAVRYLSSRGINRRDIHRWRILTAPSGRYRRRVIIPSFSSDGTLNYFVSRAIDSGVKPKYVNSYVPKKEVVFNEIDIDWFSPVYLVEGPFDAMKCPENTIPILGSSLSKSSKLFHHLSKNSCDVTVSLDPDLKSKAYILAQELSKAGCSVKICFAPKGNDLGSMSREEVAKVLSAAKHFDPMQVLRHKISGIKSGSIL